MYAIEQLYEKNKLNINSIDIENLLLIYKQKLINQKINNNTKVDIYGNTIPISYCFKFILSFINLKNIANLLITDLDELYNVCEHDFDTNAMLNRMYSHPFYHIFGFLLYYGLKINNQNIYNISTLCMLSRIWNGRISKFISYCDSSVMAYAIEKMKKNKRYRIIPKYDNVYDLIENHFLNNLIINYKDKILDTPGMIQNYISNMWSRTCQLFVFNRKIILPSGKLKGTGGILPYYMEAQKELKNKVKTYISEDDFNKFIDDDEYYDNLNDI